MFCVDGQLFGTTFNDGYHESSCTVHSRNDYWFSYRMCEYQRDHLQYFICCQCHHHNWFHLAGRLLQVRVPFPLPLHPAMQGIMVMFQLRQEMFAGSSAAQNRAVTVNPRPTVAALPSPRRSAPQRQSLQSISPTRTAYREQRLRGAGIYGQPNGNA